MYNLEKTTILAIDNDPNTLDLFSQLLADKCSELLLINDTQLAIQSAVEKQPDIVLLDVSLEKMDGYKVCECLKADKKTEHIPVVFFSSLLRATDKAKSFAVGAAGYILKPIEKRRQFDKTQETQSIQMTEILSQIGACLAKGDLLECDLQEQAPQTLEFLTEYHLKIREVDILRLYVSGLKRSEIAAKMVLSENTVKWYLKQIFQKTGVNSRAALLEKIRKIQF
jgi:DNA-binding NarL/FixJ family response regulator